MRIKEFFIQSLQSIFLSYAQIFFSNKVYLGVLLALVTFFLPEAGLAGLVSVVSANGIALMMGINRQKIASGHYGFNPLLVGLGLGVYYQFNYILLVVLFFSALLTFFLTLLFEGWLAKYRLPFLSLPFLFALWIVSLAAQQFTGLQISEHGVFTYNEISSNFNIDILKFHLEIQALAIPIAIKTYFFSLAAIFFQYNIYAGVLIAIGIVLVSRISFLLTLVGFFSAYFYYTLVGADFTELEYSYIGFNYILTAIAIGGFFVIPSLYSFLWVILLTPLISFIMTSSNAFLNLVGLSTFALPFNVVAITFLYALAFREYYKRGIQPTLVQHYSPEKNLYYHENHKNRFGNNPSIAISLPFYGSWIVSQAYQGKYTHKGKWRHALDFVIEEEGKEFEGEGSRLEDYYCYDKMIIAPADGMVETITDGIEDNVIGEVNLKHNWGNSIVIKHDYKLYSQMSHIKAGSFLVKTGEYVRRGQAIARVGSSGRSPYPHLHFQIQRNPYVGSETMEYPLANYMLMEKKKEVLQVNNIPKQNQEVKNLEANTALKNAFGFTPGQEWNLSIDGKDLQWKAEIDYMNNTYLHCMKSDAKAFFIKTDNRLTFTGFKGNKKSLLYKFYLSAYHVIFAWNDGMRIEDTLPAHTLGGAELILQDFIAPFYLFIKPKYEMLYTKQDSYFDEYKIQIDSSITYRGKTKIKTIFQLSEKGIDSWDMEEKGNKHHVEFSTE